MIIRGKEYMEVKDRVMVFRKNHPEWAIITEIVENNESTGSVIFKAHIEDEKGRIRGTGHAHEFKDDKTSMVNKTSHLENCETSAIGRAMASLGIGVESSYASYDEVMIAKSKEARSPKEQTEEEIKYVGNEENDPVAVQEEKINWRDTICPFPKHKGKTLGQVESEDPNYLNWILGLEDIKSDEIKNAVEQALKEKSDNGKQGFKRVA